MTSAGIFSGLGAAPTFERGNWFNGGSIHDLQIERMIIKPSRESGIGLIVECGIKTSAPTGEINKKTGQPWVPLSVGVDGTWWQGLLDKAVALPAIKDFCFAVLNLGPDDPRRGMLEQAIPGSESWPVNETRRPLAVIESLMLWATGPENIFHGLFVHLETRMTVTKKGTDFTLHIWNPLNWAAVPPGITPPNSDEIIRRAMTPPPPIQAAPPVQPAWAGGGYGAPPPMAQQPPPAANPGWGPPMAQQPPVTGFGPPAQTWGAPPPAAPPPLPMASPGLPPGAQVNGNLYWAPGMSNWAPIPGR